MVTPDPGIGWKLTQKNSTYLIKFLFVLYLKKVFCSSWFCIQRNINFIVLLKQVIYIRQSFNSTYTYYYLWIFLPIFNYVPSVQRDSEIWFVDRRAADIHVFVHFKKPQLASVMVHEPRVEVTEPISRFPFFPKFSALSKHTLAIKYQVSPQLSCSDICEI